MPATAHDTPPVEQLVADRSFFGHPAGLRTLFAVEMWERFSYYGLRPLLILFMTTALGSGGFGLERATAGAIVGIYAAGVYLATLPGGWIADRWLGLQRAVWWGGVIIASGHLSIGLSAIFGRPAFYLGLVLIVIGTGLLKGNISAIVGDLYPQGGPRRDAGFAIYYMGINTGATIGQIVTGFLGEKVGWHFGFGAAGVGMLIGLITFRVWANRTLGTIGTTVAVSQEQQSRARLITLSAFALIGLLLVAGTAGLYTVDPVAIAGYSTKTLIGLAFAYFGYLFIFGGLDGDERKRIAVIALLFVGGATFWAAFEQAPTSLNLFARDFTDRHVFGYEIPATWLQSVNSFFVVALSPVFAALWSALGKRGIAPSSPAKFAAGLLVCGIGFYMMLIPAGTVISSGGVARVSIWWLTVSYLFQTMGELSVSPVGLSSMTKLAPRRFSGQMMGVWFLATSVGNLIAGLVGGSIDPEKLDLMPQLFSRTALSLFAVTALFVVLIVPIRNMMRTSTAVDH